MTEIINKGISIPEKTNWSNSLIEWTTWKIQENISWVLTWNNITSYFRDRLIKRLEEWNIDWLWQIIMEMITTRPEFVKEKYWTKDDDFLVNLKNQISNQVDYYKKVIQSLEKQCKKDQILETADNPAWFSLKTKNQSESKDKMNYKIYETIPIKNYDYVSKIYQLWLMLDKLSKESKDKISLKVPHNMLWFLSHSDSIVIHFKNIDNKNKIEEILEEWKSKNAIHEEPRHLWRTKFAADSENSSFSQLVSDNIEKWIWENYQKYDNELIADLAIEYAIKQSQTPPKIDWK